MRALLFSNLFPTSADPNRGLFTRQLAAEIARLCELEVAVPLPWFPSNALAARLAPASARDVSSLAPELEFAGVPLLCPHYEADLIGGDSFSAVHIVSDVAAFYAAFGVQVSAVAHERPDYIGVELDFMRLLASKETYAAARGDRRHVRLCRTAQARFFEEHLGRWAPMFAENLGRVVDSLFYQAAADLLLQFVAAETTYLAVTPRPIEPFANRPPDTTTPAGVIPLAVVS